MYLEEQRWVDDMMLGEPCFRLSSQESSLKSDSRKFHSSLLAFEVSLCKGRLDTLSQVLSKTIMLILGLSPQSVYSKADTLCSTELFQNQPKSFRFFVCLFFLIDFLAAEKPGCVFLEFCLTPTSLGLFQKGRAVSVLCLLCTVFALGRCVVHLT